MKILVITNNYPSNSNPHRGTFVFELVQKFVMLGNEVTVINPIKRTLSIIERNTNYGHERAKVYTPKYYSFSNKKILKFNTYNLGKISQIKVIKSVVKSEKLEFDVIYAHFISNALIAVSALKEYNKPIFVGVGEYKGLDYLRRYYNKSEYNRLIGLVDGFIAVSPQIKQKLISFGVKRESIIIEPNGVDLNQFKPLDKGIARNRFELPHDKIIVLFVGRFLDQKGPLRLLEALKQLPDQVVGVFIGKGPQKIDHEKVVFKSIVPHDQMPSIMSAADIFVLPTLHEGSSNVIVEAMASGLPIITSDLPEIRIQCDEKFSFLIDPMNIDAIKTAIEELAYNGFLREKYSKAAILHSRNFDLKERARRILFFMKAWLKED